MLGSSTLAATSFSSIVIDNESFDENFFCSDSSSQTSHFVLDINEKIYIGDFPTSTAIIAVEPVIPIWKETLLSQYYDSPTLVSLIHSFSDAVDPAHNIANFYANIWNVATAVGTGLDIWGQIVGCSRYLQIPSTPYFGFEEAYTVPTALTGAQPFQQAPFYEGVQQTTNFAMSDTQYRQLIFVKAAANISNLSVPSINALLRAEFSVNNGIDPFGPAYVVDNLNMTFTYYLDFIPSSAQIAIVTSSGVFPRPAGVQMIVNYL